MNPTIQRSSLVLAKAATAVLVSGAGLLLFAAPAFADIAPSGCLNNDFVVNLNKSTALAYDETNPNGATIITYSVSAGNPQDGAGKGCNVNNVSISLTDPAGVVHTIQTAGNYPIGTALSTLPTTVQYTAASADEISSDLNDSIHVTGDIHNKNGNTSQVNHILIDKSDSVSVIHPNTLVTITPSATAVAAGGTVNFTVTEQNTGDDDISSPSVTVDNGVGTLAKASASFTGGDIGNDGILGVGETWTWIITGIVVNSATTFTATGDGVDDLNNQVTAPTYASESADTKVSIVNAKISITPDGTNEINHKHVFTGHVDVDPGSGFTNAPDGTVISFASASGPGTFDTPTCTTSGGTGSCTDGLTSTIPGVTVVNASTDVTVSSVLLHRTTNSSSGNSGPATKTWVDANIQISPLTAQNPLGKAHTLTVHINVNTGTGGYVNAPDGTVVNLAIASGPGSLTTPSCTTSGGTGSCTDDLNNALTTGITVINASTDVVVGGITLHRTTDGTGANSGSANKTWTQTALTTTASASVQVGGKIHDVAHLSGTSNIVAGAGHITFTVYGPGDTSCATPLATLNAIPDPVTGDGDYTSQDFMANAAGTYIFIAHYNGDANNNAISGACKDANESVTVTQPPAGQYCSPGYWKQQQHFGNWVGAVSTDKFSAIFGITPPITISWSDKGKPGSTPNPTVLQALQANGGGINLIAREAVDAFLNAGKLQFGFNQSQIVTTVQAAVAANDPSLLDQFTIPENCPLN